MANLALDKKCIDFVIEFGKTQNSMQGKLARKTIFKAFAEEGFSEKEPTFFMDRIPCMMAILESSDEWPLEDKAQFVFTMNVVMTKYPRLQKELNERGTWNTQNKLVKYLGKSGEILFKKEQNRLSAESDSDHEFNPAAPYRKPKLLKKELRKKRKAIQEKEVEVVKHYNTKRRTSNVDSLLQASMPAKVNRSAQMLYDGASNGDEKEEEPITPVISSNLLLQHIALDLQFAESNHVAVSQAQGLHTQPEDLDHSVIGMDNADIDVAQNHLDHQFFGATEFYQMDRTVDILDEASNEGTGTTNSPVQSLESWISTPENEVLQDFGNARTASESQVEDENQDESQAQSPLVLNVLPINHQIGHTVVDTMHEELNVDENNYDFEIGDFTQPNQAMDVLDRTHFVGTGTTTSPVQTPENLIGGPEEVTASFKKPMSESDVPYSTCSSDSSLSPVNVNSLNSPIAEVEQPPADCSTTLIDKDAQTSPFENLSFNDISVESQRPNMNSKEYEKFKSSMTAEQHYNVVSELLLRKLESVEVGNQYIIDEKTVEALKVITMELREKGDIKNAQNRKIAEHIRSCMDIHDEKDRQIKELKEKVELQQQQIAAKVEDVNRAAEIVDQSTRTNRQLLEENQRLINRNMELQVQAIRMKHEHLLRFGNQ